MTGSLCPFTRVSTVSDFYYPLAQGETVQRTVDVPEQVEAPVEAGFPVPQGEDYQRGEMLGHYNVRQYVLWRDGYTCRCCGAHGKNVKFHVHHLEGRKTGGKEE